MFGFNRSRECKCLQAKHCADYQAMWHPIHNISPDSFQLASLLSRPACLSQHPLHLSPQGYAPLVSWARDMVISLHKPATLQPHPQPQAPDTPTHSTTSPSQQQYEPVGMDVVVTPGASAALDSLVRVLVNPGDAVLVEEYTYAHMAEAHLLPLG